MSGDATARTEMTRTDGANEPRGRRAEGWIVGLESPEAASIERVGGKAIGLHVLIGAGIPAYFLWERFGRRRDGAAS